jgi:hypothetical protein
MQRPALMASKGVQPMQSRRKDSFDVGKDAISHGVALKHRRGAKGNSLRQWKLDMMGFSGRPSYILLSEILRVVSVYKHYQ